MREMHRIHVSARVVRDIKTTLDIVLSSLEIRGKTKTGFLINH